MVQRRSQWSCRRSSQQRMERLRAEHAAAKEALFNREVVLGTPFMRKKLMDRARNTAIQRMVGGDPTLLMTPRFQDVDDYQAAQAEATLSARLTPRAGLTTPGATMSSSSFSGPSGATTARGRFFGDQPMSERMLSQMVPLPPIEALMNPVMVAPPPDKQTISSMIENDPELSTTAGSRMWRARSREVTVGPTCLSALLRQLQHATELKLEDDRRAQVAAATRPWASSTARALPPTSPPFAHPPLLLAVLSTATLLSH